LSNIAPEGAPAPIPDASAKPASFAFPTPEQIDTFFKQVQQEEKVVQGLSPAHVAGGSLGGFAAAIVLGVCNHYHLHVSDVDAAIIGSGALSAGAGVGHVIVKYGVFPALKKLFTGRA